MLALSAVLIRRLLPQLSTESPRQEGLRTWIEGGSFYVGIGSVADEVLFQNLRLTEIVPFIAYDFERFALSSIESALHHGTEIMGPKALGWPLVRLYYAAFFGAHAMMRATGRAVLRLENSQALRISQIGSFYLPDFKISTGTYKWALVQNPDLTIDGQMRRLPEGGGAHDQFWKTFYEFLGSISDEVVRNKEPEATAATAEASDLRDILSSNGFSGGTWLSAVRNQLTYQHRYGAWFPFQRSDAETVEYMRRSEIKDSGSIRRDHNVSKHPLLAFAAGCQLITSLSCEIAEGLCQRSGNTRFKQLLNQLRAPEAAQDVSIG
jgi:hypothetical protein